MEAMDKKCTLLFPIVVGNNVCDFVAKMVANQSFSLLHTRQPTDMDSTSALAATAAASAVSSSVFPSYSTPRHLQQPELDAVFNLGFYHSYADKFAPKDWLPEVYLKNMAGSVDDYRKMIKTLAIWKGLPGDVRLYARRLNDYFKTELGELLLKNLYTSSIVLSKQTVHQQLGASVIFSQSSRLLGKKSRYLGSPDQSTIVFATCLDVKFRSFSIGARSDDDAEVRLTDSIRFCMPSLSNILILIPWLKPYICHEPSSASHS